jgi:hypothetical protein
MKITEKKFNVMTGEETFTERDETPAEIKQREKFEAAKAAEAAEYAAFEAAKEPVKAKLAALGLTTDDLIALGL